MDNQKALSKFTLENGYNATCDYCKNSTIVIEKSKIIDLINESVATEWDQPENVLGRVDGEWIGTVLDSYDLVMDELQLGGAEIFQDIVDSLSDPGWCEKNPYGPSDSDQMIYSWDKFCDHIKYKSRFFFQQEITSSVDEHNLFTANEVLNILAERILELDMITTIDLKTIIYRARPCTSKYNFTNERELGVPENEYIKFPNRFSPSGIQMFYGAENVSTCLHEIGKPEHACIGEWKTIKKLKVLDFTNIFYLRDNKHYAKDFPDVLEPDRRHLRPAYLFLQALANDFSKPIKSDGREHIDYVPTQVVSEYFRKNLKTFIKSKRIDGIKSYSSKSGGINYALYFDPENCYKGDNQKIKLQKVIKYKLPV